MNQRGLSMLEVVVSSVLAGMVGLILWQTSQNALNEVEDGRRDIEARWLAINGIEWVRSDFTRDMSGVAYDMNSELNTFPMEAQFTAYTGANGLQMRMDRGGWGAYAGNTWSEGNNMGMNVWDKISGERLFNGGLFWMAHSDGTGARSF